MGFAERMSQSCNTDDLKARDDKLGDVEHVAALSGAPEIGSDLLRARDYDANALRRAILLLANKAMHRLKIGRAAANMLAIVAVQEVMHWQCRKCNGAAEVIIGDLKQICPKCNGQGVHRWSDGERAQAARGAGLKTDNWLVWDRKYQIVLDIARRDDSQTLGCSREKLTGKNY